MKFFLGTHASLMVGALAAFGFTACGGSGDAEVGGAQTPLHGAACDEVGDSVDYCECTSESKWSCADPDFESLCRDIIAANCAGDSQDVSECVRNLRTPREEQPQCRAEMDRFLFCAEHATLECDPRGDVLAIPVGCETANDAVESCLGTDGSTGHEGPCFGGGTSAAGNAEEELACDATCSGVSAACERVEGVLECECATGPKVGENFSVASCDDLMNDLSMRCGAE